MLKLIVASLRGHYDYSLGKLLNKFPDYFGCGEQEWGQKAKEAWPSAQRIYFMTTQDGYSTIVDSIDTFSSSSRNREIRQNSRDSRPWINFSPKKCRWTYTPEVLPLASRSRNCIPTSGSVASEKRQAVALRKMLVGMGYNIISFIKVTEEPYKNFCDYLVEIS